MRRVIRPARRRRSAGAGSLPAARRPAPPRGPPPVVHAVVTPLAERILADRPPGMVGHVTDVGREERLIALVHADGRVGPPQERLHQRRAVVDPHLQLDQRLARMQAHAVHPLHPQQRIMVAEPDGLRAVGVLFDVEVDGQEGGGAMVLRPIELDAAGDPRPGQADQGRLDDRLPVDEVVAVGLVLGDVDAAADLRQQHDAEILVFQPNGLPGAIGRRLGDPIGAGQGIDPAAAALVDPALQEHRVALGQVGQIGGDHLLGDADGHRVVLGHGSSSSANFRRNSQRAAGFSRVGEPPGLSRRMRGALPRRFPATPRNRRDKPGGSLDAMCLLSGRAEADQQHALPRHRRGILALQRAQVLLPPEVAAALLALDAQVGPLGRDRGLHLRCG